MDTLAQNSRTQYTRQDTLLSSAIDVIFEKYFKGDLGHWGCTKNFLINIFESVQMRSDRSLESTFTRYEFPNLLHQLRKSYKN